MVAKPRPRMYHYLSVVDDAVVMQSKPLADPVGSPYKAARSINSVRQLDDLRSAIAEDDIVLCSSSMDFPHEYTKDRKIWRLCARIREGNPMFCGRQP